MKLFQFISSEGMKLPLDFQRLPVTFLRQELEQRPKNPFDAMKRKLT